MPIIKRTETDMFRLAPIADFMVNPVTLMGKMEVGINKDFVDKHPCILPEYQKALENPKFCQGVLLTVTDPNSRYKIINMPTKRHFADDFSLSDLQKNLDTLRRVLSTPENKLKQVVMPILAGQRSESGYDEVLPYFYDALDDLDACVHLCMHPAVVGRRFRYLGIVGPRIYGSETSVGSDGETFRKPDIQIKDEIAAIHNGVDETLKAWGVDPSTYDGIVSGGADGVDRVACGQSRDDDFYDHTVAKRLLPEVKPIIIKADWARYGLGAGMIRNTILDDVATDLIGFRPEGIKSIGTTAGLRMALRNNLDLNEDDPQYTRVRIIGDQNVDTQTGMRQVIKK